MVASRLAGRLVGDHALHQQQRTLARALVDHVNDAMARDDGAGGAKRPMQGEMLLAMHRHLEIHAGAHVAQQERLEAQHDREGRQHLEVFLVDEGEFARVDRIVPEPDAKRVQHDVFLGVAPFGVRQLQRQQLCGIKRHGCAPSSASRRQFAPSPSRLISSPLNL